MDFNRILAMAQQQRSVPGLLAMLRGGDPQTGGGRRLAPEQGQGGGQGQLQMAQAAMHEGDYGNVINAQDPLPAWRSDPKNWVQNGHIIGADKFFQDTHRPISDPASSGSLHPYRGFPNANAWSTTGEVGYFGQMDPWATMWGAGGPGGN